MKKYLLLFLTAGLLSLGACSSDDDGDTTEEMDPIVGTWVLVQIDPDVINVQACEEPSTLTFNEDNTASGTFYLEQDDCEPASSGGNWKNRGNSVYEVDVPFLGTLDGTVNFPNPDNPDSFTFSPQQLLGATFTFERQ